MREQTLGGTIQDAREEKHLLARWSHQGNWCVLGMCLLALAPYAFGESDGLLTRSGARVFPIGFYELPADDAGLKTMADAGVTMAHCHSRADLDRVQRVGMSGVFPLALQEGASDKLKALVTSVVDHPALVVWEGPDEVVWNFTAYSGLFTSMKVHSVKDSWWKQMPEAVAYAEKQSAEILPKMREAAAFIRSQDKLHRPVWINEAQKSDLSYVRQYLGFVDIMGCDIYPIRDLKRPIANVGGATDRWVQVGKGKPVWMVLQAFSWHELGEGNTPKNPAYPTFAESEFMAFDAIAHGARGLLYWGSSYTKNVPFRESLFAVTRELARLQPFLVAPDVREARLSVVELPFEQPLKNVRMIVRKVQSEYLIVLLNEDDQAHMGVVVNGLAELNGRPLHRLYGNETAAVTHGEFVARLLPGEVRVYCTDRKYEAANRQGRDFTW
jgi:hypothetical protein